MYKKTNIKSQDIVILLKIIASVRKREEWNTVTLSRALYISQSEISESLSRSGYVGFFEKNTRLVFKNALMEFLVYGVKYAFPVRPGHLTRGILTAHSAPPLANMILSGGDVYVWPYAFGSARGQAIEPLYHTVPRAVSEDKRLYEMLALVDAIRVGKVREKDIAKKELEKRIMKDIFY